MRKADRKIRDLDRAAKKRAARLAAMTAEERAAYDRWQAAHRPGSAAERERRRKERRENTALRAERQKPPAEPSPELREIRAEIEAAERRLASLTAEDDEGIFG